MVAARLLAGATGDDTRPSVSALDLPTTAAEQVAAPPPPSGEPVRIEDASSPQAAVEGLLGAEARGDFTASYAFLSEADRIAWPTPAAWVAAHAELPPITGYTVEEVRDDTVVTLLALRSELNPVVGLVPARSRATWRAVEEDGGWRVLYGTATASPLYPGDEGVGDAVSRWARARQRCATEAQQEGSLVGAPALADRLCGADGELALGQPGLLTDGPETTPLLNAYGPEVFTWARVVPVVDPVEMLVVTGPIDDRWRVVGVLPVR